MTARSTGIQEMHTATIGHLLNARLCVLGVVRPKGGDVPTVKCQSEVRGASGVGV